MTELTRGIFQTSKLTDIYIRSGLNEKNTMAVNTINFIDNQLNIIEDSLSFIENQLENQPVLQFSFELADKDSILRFRATELYEKFKAWCDETGKGQLNQTRFGKELKKMDGLVKKFKNLLIS